ncbi:ABC transporter substrate-binding protein [Methylobacterium aquaticum]|uniref:ABC transporter substrate-binding protein n=1 Tax=Methylobacterium aquaticum TaxID=270351 RepID=UPI003D17F7BD
MTRLSRALARTTALTAGLSFALAAGLAFAVAAQAQTVAPKGASDGVVKIGILNDQSGVYADFGGRGSVEAARMAVEDFGGKVLDVPVQIVDADHQNKPDVASNIARQWYDTDRVDAIMELTTSSVALAVQGLSKEKRKITIVDGAATSDLTGKQCTPYGFHWAYDTHALAVGTGGSLVETGGDTWFFLTADYAFGTALQADVTQYVTQKGGKVVGAVRHPLSAQDFSSFLLQAQGSGAKIIGLANAGLDTANAIKQASEFGIVQGGQRLAALLFTLAEVHGLGLKAAQGIVLTEGYYWDLDDQARAFAKRYMARTGKMPNMIQAGTYSSVTHYLKAVKAAGTDDTDAVAAKMREMKVDDFFGRGGTVQANGRMVHDMYLFQVKSPAESKAPWDYYKLLATIPGDKAFLSAKASGCPLTQ